MRITKPCANGQPVDAFASSARSTVHFVLYTAYALHTKDAAHSPALMHCCPLVPTRTVEPHHLRRRSAIALPSLCHRSTVVALPSRHTCAVASRPSLIRYKLLIDTILKHTDAGAEHDSLTSARDTLDAVGRSMDQALEEEASLS